MLEMIFTKQAELDAHILEDVDITDEQLYRRRLIALFTEIGEMAEPTNDHHELLKEGVDVLHFLASLALLEGVRHDEIVLYDHIFTNDGSFGRSQTMASRSLGFLLSATANYANSKEGVWKYWKRAPREGGCPVQHFEKMFNMLITHLKCHGVGKEELLKAYLAKNDENHLRKQNNY